MKTGLRHTFSIFNFSFSIKNCLCSLLFAFLSVSCDVISDANRIAEMDEVIPQKKVLLLDFTDQQCINCPQAAVVIDSLQANYGENVVAVSIHTSRVTLPLVTQEGIKYDEKFGINYTHPAAVIDGLGNYIADLWTGKVLERFNIQQQANIELTANYNSENKQIYIVSEIFDVSLQANLKYQLWLVEDSIVDWQSTGAGKYDFEYVHNHVFRTSINGWDGERLTLANGAATLNHKFTASSEKWNRQHLSVVGFIFNALTNEVYDVNEIKLINE